MIPLPNAFYSLVLFNFFYMVHSFGIHTTPKNCKEVEVSGFILLLFYYSSHECRVEIWWRFFRWPFARLKLFVEILSKCIAHSCVIELTYLIFNWGRIVGLKLMIKYFVMIPQITNTLLTSMQIVRKRNWCLLVCNIHWYTDKLFLRFVMLLTNQNWP